MKKENNQILIGKSNELSDVCVNYSRYNGGWVKTITGIDKSKTNGYSLIGDFVKFPSWAAYNTLLLDCSIDGSRNHPERNYHLLQVTQNGDLNQIYNIKNGGKDWAIKFWDKIEEYLNSEIPDENPLAGYSDQELIDELKRRNIV